MKPVVIFLFFYLAVFQTVFVESGVIFDNIKSGISTTGNTIKCGIHKVGGFLLQRQDNRCGGNNQDEKNNEIGTNEAPSGTNVEPEKTEKLSSSTEATVVKIPDASHTVEPEKTEKLSSTTEATVVTVPEGKRLIGVGANCPEGFRGDGKGNCREEY